MSSGCSSRRADAYLALVRTAGAVATRSNRASALFEVPFSVRPASSQMILRGTFDCLIQRRDGGITVARAENRQAGVRSTNSSWRCT